MHKIITSIALVAATSLPVLAQTEADITETEVGFVSADGADLGTARLIDVPSGLLIRLDLRDLPADQWIAFHIHEGSECDVAGNFESAGAHWDEGGNAHGYLAEGGPHTGDMPNMYVRGDGRLVADVFNPWANLSGDEGNVTGRTLIFHTEADDYMSQPSGDAGDRLACAVIE
jgi:superoxide dismutase, Cu-Zn family